jgi:hypothetical protein
MLKEEGYYEPIYSYTIDNKKLTIAKEFKEYDTQLSKTLRAVFKEIIKPFFDLICRPQESMPTVYKAERPLLLYDLVQKLDKYEYGVEKLVMNFNSKIIGVVASEPVSEKTCFVPCYPSAVDENLKKDLDYVFMTDLSLWTTYDRTVTFLNKLYKRSKKRRDRAEIQCKPEFKIVEDEHVVGILTNTNQFIQISQPLRLDEIDKDFDLPSITDENYIIDAKTKDMNSSDAYIMTNNGVDKERVDYIKKIRLESNFYNVFRSSVRIMLNDYENIKIREQIESEMLKEYIIYSDKLKNIDRLLRQLASDQIQFSGDKDYYKLINEVSTCIVKSDEKCAEEKNLCALTEQGKCNLILPEMNLLTGKPNEPVYYGRMADELIRYKRIKTFILQPQTYLAFGNIGYNLREDEIILIQSMLTQEYFETLVPALSNKYIKNRSYDEVQPIITQLYENTIPSLDHAIGRKNEVVCDKSVNKHITSSIWKKCFPSNFSEIEYTTFNFCTFNFIIDLLERKIGKRLSINDIRNELYDEYNKYLVEHKSKIVDILVIEGKKTLGDQVSADTLSFASFLYTDNYFLTTLDMWLLITKYKIPTMFICQKWILQTKYERHEFLGYGKEGDDFAFIVLPGFRPENVPKYRLIQDSNNNVFIPLDKLEEPCVERILSAIRHAITIEDYLLQFKKPKTTVYEKKKPDQFLIETDSEDPIHKPKRTKLLIEETEPISPEEFILEPKPKQSKKNVVVLKGKPQTKKNIKKRRLLIVDSTPSAR